MKKTKVVILMALCLFAFSSVASAQVQKIGVVDLSRAFDGYEKTKEFDAMLEEKSKAFEGERNAKIDELKEMQSKLTLLKEEEKGKVEKEFSAKRDSFLSYDQEKQTDLRKQRDDKIREILLEIEKVVSDYAKKEKFDLILNDRVLIYGNETLNVTEQILTILNDSYNKK